VADAETATSGAMVTTSPKTSAPPVGQRLADGDGTSVAHYWTEEE
jgi:hypothetical protein